MSDGERRRLVITNLVNGVPVEQVMAALHLSEKDVLADFKFVTDKVRSYVFERAMPLIPCGTIPEARNNRVAVLWAVARLNLDKPALFGRIETLPFTLDNGGGISPAEQRIFEARARAGG